jgi:hypothetical protein
MMIPAEAVPLVENSAGRSSENRKTAPVRYASETGYESSHSASGEAQDDRSHERRLHYSDDMPFGPESAEPHGERRHGERRHENKPVLLDTRLRQVLRRKIDTSGISLKI